MIICVCHRVSDRDIAREVAHGCRSFDALQDLTRVATGCGACVEFAQECFAAHAGGGCRDQRGCPDCLLPMPPRQPAAARLAEAAS